MVVPQLSDDIRALKQAVGRFVESEVYPFETRIAERGSIDRDELEALRAKARDAGFAMLNMPGELGGGDLSMLGQVALEEEAGKATNGLGFAVVDRGPRELYEIATPEQIDRYVRPIANGEYREAWAITEPGAGSDLTGLQTTATRDGDVWVLNGEKWFVTSEGEPGVYIVLAVADGEHALFLVEPGMPGMEIRRTPSFLHDPYIDHHSEITFNDCRVPAANRVPASGDAGAKEWILVERLFIAARCCGAALRLVDSTADWAKGREAFGAPISEYQGISFPLADSLTELHAARLLTYHAGHAFDVLEDRKIVHGKVSMAKLYASEMAGRVADRAVQALGGRGYMVESPAARFYRELRVDRIWEGTSEIQRSIISRGVFKRGAAPYLGWAESAQDRTSASANVRSREDP
jgi:acyl-CoA dehydrogenase